MGIINNFLQSGNLSRKHKNFLLGIWGINIVTIVYLCALLMERYETVFACKAGKQPPAYYEWKEQISNSNFGRISLNGFCDLNFAMPGLIVILFYISSIVFLGYFVFMLKNSERKKRLNFFSIFLFLSGIFFMLVPYIYAEAIPNL